MTIDPLVYVVQSLDKRFNIILSLTYLHKNERCVQQICLKLVKALAISMWR